MVMVDADRGIGSRTFRFPLRFNILPVSVFSVGSDVLLSGGALFFSCVVRICVRVFMSQRRTSKLVPVVRAS